MQFGAVSAALFLIELVRNAADSRMNIFRKRFENSFLFHLQQFK